MRIAINGWFIDQPHTGSGQYIRQLAARLPAIAPQHDYFLIVPDRRSFKIIDLTSTRSVQLPTSEKFYSSSLSSLEPPPPYAPT